jgi:4-amino-4-deoxy-L-arabinose transferase-like glycosyltransferase
MDFVGKPDINSTEVWNRSPYFIAFCLWVVPTLININKAFHIDDTFYLEVAKWIVDHPLKPMSGMVNWYNDPEPFSNANQPPLFFYMIAAWSRLSGTTEVAMHLLQSVFSYLCILFSYKVFRLVSREHAAVFTALFAFNPAFIVNQNMMTDIPLLAATLAFVYMLLVPGVRTEGRRYVWAALLVSAALMIKYTALPLVVVLIISIVVWKQYRQLFVVLIPVAVLVLWSVWNYYEFGSVHLLHRGGGIMWERIPVRVHSVLLCLGGTSFFSLIILFGLLPARRLATTAAVAATIALPLLAALVYSGKVGEPDAAAMLGGAFLVNGALLVVGVVYCFFRYQLAGSNRDGSGYPLAMMYWWVAAIASFVILLAPFVATRHLLLLLVPVLAIFAQMWGRVPEGMRKVIIGGTVLAGCVLGISDWQYADYYRRGAADIRAHTAAGSRVWGAGHWGWQWYCSQARCEPLGVTTSAIQDGDLLVMPKDVSRQDTHGLQMTRVGAYWYNPGIWSFFSVSRHAAMYATSPGDIPWEFSSKAIDTFVVYRIGKP